MQSFSSPCDMAMANSVRELAFSDLYLGHPDLQDRVADAPGAASPPQPPGPGLRADMARLKAACNVERERRPGAGEFKVAYDGAHYRVATLPAQGGDVFVVRRIAGAVASLAELGIPQAYIRRMTQRDLSGLFIVSGPINSGKTMTAAAMLKDRLLAHGGVAVTAEDPVELPLEGPHGHGLCFQTALPGEPGERADALRNMLRWRAGTLLVGELRDQECATELLRTSFNGALGITTMLAGDVVQTVTRLHSLLDERLGPGHARALLADGLLGVLHQRMVRGARHPAKLETEFLFLKDAPVARDLLRKGEFAQLGGEIRKQLAVMIAENAAAQRPAPG
ncbi:ATPase, T2SS/T4P/T4SS family [Duganella radicis]|uniref:Bacterial type II secretion system protein E domain-containing protein n=1 Tax=Duganella radicis TaxID=551988 RepID=A0A6L6PRI9_9BURK|nr:ATPase, T2SS/T4P/T4SS family [Duganella radicis]MTV41728.1 hypothetical protein [Duganella radicis]